MHATNINQVVGYLVLHEKIIDEGYSRHMLFQEDSDVPFFMAPQERVSTKFSKYDEPQLKDNTKDNFLGNLKSYCVYISVVKGKKVGELQYISRKNPISVTMTISK